MEFEILKRIIAQVLCVDPEEISEGTSFVEDLCADSLDLFQIVMGIEEEFDIEISQADTEGVRTVGDAVRLIEESTESGR